MTLISKARNIKGYWKWAMSLLFAVVVYWFWICPYVSILSYQEQYQLFLFNSDYFISRIAVPGGLVDYLSEFFVQFYYVPKIGALILALIFLGLQRHTWIVFRQENIADYWYLLSFLPAVILWFMISDENVLPTFPISITMVLVLISAYNRVAKCCSVFGEYLFLLVAIVLGYWLIGPSVFLLSIWAVSKEIKKERSLKSVGVSLIILVVTLLPPLACSTILPYGLGRFFVGLNYYRFPEYDASVQCLVALLFIAAPVVVGLLPQTWTGRKSLIASIMSFAVAWICGGLLVFGSFNTDRNDLIDYDYLVRSEQWDKIIKKAEKKPSLTPMGVSCINLALSQKGLLTERLFEFYQNGPEGLIPPFTRDMTAPVPTAEIFFRLGCVNDTHRYMFEAQESIPNSRKSGRLMKRLIQCEIVNGNYAVARKWLSIMEQSLFYRKWAKETLALLYDEDAINRNPLYGKLRNLRPKKDYLFSDEEMDQMLGMVFVTDYSNRMAYEYLMCWVLLQRNMEKFMKYYPIGQLVGYNRIPTVFQEVLIGESLQHNPDSKKIPYKVESQPLNNTMGFIRLYMQNHDNPALDTYPYNINAWNYLTRGSAIKNPNIDKPKEGIY